MLLLLLIPALAAAATSSSSFNFTLHLPMRSLPTLDETFWAVSTPSDQRYGKFPTLSSLATTHGASPSHISLATAYLLQRGAVSTRVSLLRDHVVGTFDVGSGHALSLSSLTGHPTDLPDFVEFSVRGDGGSGDGKTPTFQPADEYEDGDDDRSSYTVSQIKAAYG